MVEFLNTVYTNLGLVADANVGDVFGLTGAVLTLIFSIPMWRKAKTSEEQVKLDSKPEFVSSKTNKIKSVESIKVPETEKTKKPWAQRLAHGLSKSRTGVWDKLGRLIGSGNFDQSLVEDIEELLYGADIGPQTVAEVIEEIENQVKSGDLTSENFKPFLMSYFKKILDPFHMDLSAKENLFQYDSQQAGKTKTIMIVGVNGAGKTTTIGKLATRLTRQGAQVCVGAGDTFRAAAVDQLQVWCERAGAQMTRAKEGSNPSGVAYETLEKALQEKADYCIIDTAGRLHNNQNLMKELEKIKSVLTKLDPEAPHEVLLVLDSISGQNALRQAQEFNKSLNLSGVIFTKCDGSSKAGSAIGVVRELKVPIVYIGVGEDVDDLDRFDVDEYLSALVGHNLIESKIDVVSEADVR